MNKVIFTLLIGFIGFTVFGQEIMTKSAYISFFSEKESILAENNSVVSRLNVSNGEIVFSVPIQSFKFEKSLMQKHFNQEGVMNSAEYPKAKFKGVIINNAEVDYTADGEYNVKIEGKLSIKGTTNKISVKGKIIVKGGKISANSTFSLDRFEYGVDAKKNSVSQHLKITVKANYE